MLPPSSSSCRRPQAAQRESKCELLLLLRAAGRKLKIAFIIARKEIM
jgi:hypothetical protein